jgi:hypothetical protein
VDCVTTLTDRHGSAKKPERDVAKPRPDGMPDEVVAALGKLSEALEAAEHARGLLYGFHRLCGTADLTLQEAVAKFRDAGLADLADQIETCLVGRDIVDGRWSFQIVEAYDSGYWSVFRDVEREARERTGAAQHIFEAEMKHREQQEPTTDG